ncbi:MAG: hypothetical protein A3H32_00855 [Betaproteobacteria bacterium RIFCSPLOWO2_02_FULL_63_19]|nr:MAG: hypothetical protein A3H32_00855 [Betaproteobacteria bacterium RIFCSPLOWO2_02_FULL_63_19]
MTIQRLRSAYERFLEWLVLALMVVLAAEVTLGVLFRTIGMALSWYDEVASVLLAWLTFYGAALAALKRAHIGFSGLVAPLPPIWRVLFALIAELLVFAFFLLLAWVGYQVLAVVGNDRLVSLPWIPVAVTQSVIPASALMFILAEAFNLPQVFREAMGHSDTQTSDLAQMTH